MGVTNAGDFRVSEERRACTGRLLFFLAGMGLDGPDTVHHTKSERNSRILTAIQQLLMRAVRPAGPV